MTQRLHAFPVTASGPTAHADYIELTPGLVPAHSSLAEPMEIEAQFRNLHRKDLTPDNANDPVRLAPAEMIALLAGALQVTDAQLQEWHTNEDVNPDFRQAIGDHMEQRRLTRRPPHPDLPRPRSPGKYLPALDARRDAEAAFRSLLGLPARSGPQASGAGEIAPDPEGISQFKDICRALRYYIDSGYCKAMQYALGGNRLDSILAACPEHDRERITCDYARLRSDPLFLEATGHRNPSVDDVCAHLHAIAGKLDRFIRQQCPPLSIPVLRGGHEKTAVDGRRLFISTSIDPQIAKDFAAVAQPGRTHTFNFLQLEEVPGLPLMAAVSLAEDLQGLDALSEDPTLEQFLDTYVGLGGEEEILLPSGLNATVTHVSDRYFMDDGDAQVFLQVKALRP